MIALVPARSGSKRIPNKNIKSLGGVPLIAWTLIEAFESDVFSGVYVSTDSHEIAQVAAAWTGAKAYIRPKHMARDDSRDIEWVKQILAAIEYDHHKNGNLCCVGRSHWANKDFAILRPTSPFRNAATIQRAKLQWDDIKERYDSMRAIRRATEPAWKQWRYAPDNHEIDPITSVAAKKHLHSRPTQSLEDCWIQTAGLEMAWCRTPLETNTIAGNRVAGFVMEGQEALDINDDFDWECAETFAYDIQLEEAHRAINQ